MAMDAARCAKRLGAEKVVYRLPPLRGGNARPCTRKFEHAKEEGIEFHAAEQRPSRLSGDENGMCMQAIKCIKMELGEPDASGRRRPVADSGQRISSWMWIAVVMAIGTSPEPAHQDRDRRIWKPSRWGGIVAEEETGKTTQ